MSDQKLYLLHCQPEPRQLALWAERHGLLKLKAKTGFQQDDFGYALHSLLKSAFGPLAPKPFWYRSASEGLLAFTSHEPELLRQNARLATPDVMAALGLADEKREIGLLSKTYPTVWQSGHRLAFELRVRPVLRENRGPERDVFLVQVERKTEESEPLDRGKVYAEWLRQQFERCQAATLIGADLIQFRLIAALRQQARQADGSRVRTLVPGPEALLKGELQVNDPEAFAELLVRGVGRHRAFGFGLLLLRPAG